jgi:hypothetical protein
MVRTPYGYNDTTLIVQQLRSVGLDVTAVDAVELPSHASSARELAIGFAKDHRSAGKSKNETQRASAK